MRIIDLSHIIDETMPIYPGTEPPLLHRGWTIEKDGFAETKITLLSHTGTHIDAPAHLLKKGATLDRLPVDHFFGKAFVLDLRDGGRATIGLDCLEKSEARLQACDFLLLHTGWDRYWGKADYFHNFPVLTDAAAEWIAARGLKGVGVDAVSVDHIDSTDFTVHKCFLNRDMIIIENLAGLDGIDRPVFDFSCFPLAIKKADGSPVRAVAYLPP